MSVADSYVDSQVPTANYGSYPGLGIDKSSSRTRDSYFRFNLGGLSGTVTAAKLRLTESPTGGAANNNGAMAIRLASGAWDETSLNWNNRPGYDASTLGTIPANSIADNDVVEIDLDPAYFTGDGSYELVLIGTGNGNDTSFRSREATAGAPELILTMTGGVPAPPSNLSASSSAAGQIDLVWTDNSDGETGFTIERKPGAGGTFAAIATPGADTTSYSDTGLNAETTYFYRVLANNTHGASAYSNEANATPLEPFSGDISFASVADARVDSTSPGTTYGSDVAVGVQQSAGRTMNSYFRFSVSGLSGPVVAAKLRLKESPTGTSSSDNSPLAVRFVTGAWDEATVTWNNRPGYAATTLGTVPANSISQDQFVEIELDAASFNANGSYNLALIGTGSGNDTPFISREAGTDVPELILTVGSEPNAPSDLSGSVVSQTQIDLTWTDNASDETGFTIERKTGAGGVYATVATPAANATAFSDTRTDCGNRLFLPDHGE